MNKADMIIEQFFDEMDRHGITMKMLAEEAELNCSTLCKWRNRGKWKNYPSLYAFTTAVEALGMEVVLRKRRR